MAKPHRLAGTALLLRTMKDHRLEAAEDGVDAADGLGGLSLTRHGANRGKDEFGTAARVNRDIMRYGCDIPAEKGIQQDSAMVRIRQHFADLGRRLASGEYDDQLRDEARAH